MKEDVPNLQNIENFQIFKLRIRFTVVPRSVFDLKNAFF